MEIDYQLFDEYTLNIIIGVVTAVLGLSYPFFQQIIQQIDAKYSSILIVRKFQTEPVYKWYNRTIITSVLLMFYMPFAPGCLWKTDCFLITHSAQLLALFSSGLSVFFLIRLSQLIYKYNDPRRLLRHIITKKFEDGSFIYSKDVFNQLNDLLKFSIKTGNVDLYLQCNTLYGNASDKFVEDYHLKNPDSKEIVYPAYFYMSINDITQLCFTVEQFHPAVSHPELYLTQLFLNTKTLSVSEPTLRSIWYNVSRFIENKNFSWLLSYWALADGEFNLRFIYGVSKKTDELYNIKLLHHFILAYTLVNEKKEFFKLRSFDSNNYSYHTLCPYTLECIVDQLIWIKKKIKENPIFLSTTYSCASYSFGIRTDEFLYGFLLQFYAYIIIHIKSLLFEFSNDWSVCKRQIGILIEFSTLKPSNMFSELLEPDKLIQVQKSLNLLIQEGQDKKIDLLKKSEVSEKQKKDFSKIVASCISDRINKFPSSESSKEDYKQCFTHISERFPIKKDVFALPKDKVSLYLSYYFSHMQIDMERFLYSILASIRGLASYTVNDFSINDVLSRLNPNNNYSVISFGLSDLPFDFSEPVYLPSISGVPMSIYIFKKEDSPVFLTKDIQENTRTEILQTNNAEIANIDISYKTCLMIPNDFKHIRINVVNPIYLGKKTMSSEIKTLADIFAGKDSSKTDN